MRVRNRWSVTRSIRGAVVVCLLDLANITTKDDIIHEHKSYRNKRDNSDLEKLMKFLNDTMNPFQDNLQDKLYCLSAARTASDEVQRGLTNLGERWSAVLKIHQ